MGKIRRPSVFISVSDALTAGQEVAPTSKTKSCRRDGFDVHPAVCKCQDLSYAYWQMMSFTVQTSFRRTLLAVMKQGLLRGRLGHEHLW